MMGRHLLFSCFRILLCLTSFVFAARADKGFEPIFDGKSLAGWHAFPPESSVDWSVVNGTIRGKGSAKRQSYLVWRDENLGDFELKFSYRIPGRANTGVSIRMRPDTTGKRAFESYHADIGHVGIGPQILGAWDFHFATRKEYPCKRGTSLVIEPDGSFTTEAIEDSLTIQDIHPQQWNEVHVIAEGNYFRFFINGKLSSEFTDKSSEYFAQGSIGLQIHDPGLSVEFRDVRLKRL